ncbi:hypothetical protein ACFE04_023210 [Oxalis oulophora]
MSKYEYPRLSRAELVTVLAESQIATVTENEIKNPTPDFVSQLYRSLLINLDTLNDEDQSQLDFDALDQIENPHMLNGSTQHMNLYSRIKQVVASVDCPINFTLKDLIKPDDAKTEYFVSAILNFCLHKDSKMNLLRPIAEELTLLDEQKKEWEDKTAQLNEEIDNYNEARERELPLVQEVDAKVKELRQAIDELNKLQGALRATFRELKEKILETDKEINEAEFVLGQTIQENRDLESKIVQSPDKLQRALEAKKLAREETKNAERSARQSCQEKSAIIEVYKEAFEEMSKQFAQMQDLQKQVQTAKSIEEEHKILRSRISNNEVLDKSLDAKLDECQGQVSRMHESRKQLEKEKNLKHEEANKEFNEARSIVESKSRDLESRKRKVEAVLAEVDAIASKTNLVKESGAAKLEQLDNKCEEVVKQFQQYANSIELLLPLIFLKGLNPQFGLNYLRVRSKLKVV